jgi:RNA ligase
MLNYQFPIIETIGDVLPHIEGRTEFRVFHKDWYSVVNYVVALSETFDWDPTDPIGSSVRRECRGLIFDRDGNIISKSYHKFFNVGEKEETQSNKINLNEPHVILEKLDGSLVRQIPTGHGKDFRLGTKAGITDVSMNAEVFIADKPEYTEFIEECVRINCTAIFEWCSRKNPIVIDYPEDKLILTAIRANDHGEYIRYPAMKSLADSYSIPVVKAVDGLAIQNIDLFVKQIREWEDAEGVVIRFDDGHMAKIKADDYVLRHRSKDSIHQEKNVISAIVNDAVDDLIPLLTDNDAKMLTDFQKSFWICLHNRADQMAELYNTGNLMYPNQKDFAVEFVQTKVKKKYMPIMYAMKADKTAKEALVAMIQKSLSSQTKINESRWMWGDLKWIY